MEKMNEHDRTRTYNVSDIQNILGISRTMAYRLVNSNPFRVVRVGNRILISKKSFDEWLDKGDIQELSDMKESDSNKIPGDKFSEDRVCDNDVMMQTVQKKTCENQPNNDISTHKETASADMVMLLKLMQDPNTAKMLKGLAGLAKTTKEM